jgi:hypothetical protein
MVFYIPVPGFVGRTNRGGMHQVVGGSECMCRCGGGVIKDMCLLLCIDRSSLSSLSEGEVSRRCSESGHLPCSCCLDASLFHGLPDKAI